MEAEATSLSLKLAAEPENVRHARDEAASYAEGQGLDATGVGDLKTIVSEACSNIVRHAYPEDATERPMEVSMDRSAEELTVTVRDSGTGIRPPTGARPSSLRLGFILIGSLADFMQLRTGPGRGTELLLKVPLHPGGSRSAPPGVEDAAPVTPADGLQVALGEAAAP